MVDVEQGPLGALEEDIGAGAAQGMQFASDVGDQGPDTLHLGQELLQDLLIVQGLGLEVMLQGEVVIVHDAPQLVRQAVGVQGVAQAQTASGDLVLVGRADAATGGTDGLAAPGLLPGVIQGDVIGQDEGAGGADGQALADRHPLGLQTVNLFQQGLGGEDDAVADQAFDARAQDAGGNQMQNGLLTIDHQGMTGVVTALETHHGGGAIRQQIHHLALALVTPLGADHHDILTHSSHRSLLLSAAPCVTVPAQARRRCQRPPSKTKCSAQPASRAPPGWPGSSPTTRRPAARSRSTSATRAGSGDQGAKTPAGGW